VLVDTVEHTALLATATTNESDEYIQKRIAAARQLQYDRYQSTEKTNGDTTNTDIKQYALLEKTAIQLLNTAAERLHISARAYMKLIKIARTIADLEGSISVTSAHISEALQYRPTGLKP
jgi:magnesium chelatase family protein